MLLIFVSTILYLFCMKNIRPTLICLSAVLLTSAATLHAQTERVGVNTRTPAATLDVRVNPALATGNSNEGIIAPVLTKVRVAQITTPVTGTFVYVNNATYSGSDARVAQITEPGYYFFNGTIWVKMAPLWTHDTSVHATRLINKSDGATARNEQQNIFIDDNGQVGIGVTDIPTTLVVNGNVHVGTTAKNENAFPIYGNYLAFEGGRQKIDKNRPFYYSNTDIFALYRVDMANDISELRMSIGDNDGTTDRISMGIALGHVLGRENDPGSSFYPGKGWTEKFRFEANGNASKTTGATWLTLSDRRLKENINPYTRGLKELLQIHPVSFTYKGDIGKGLKRQVGVIAQDLEKVVPSMVEAAYDVAGYDSVKTVNGNEYTFMLINAIKEQQQQLDTQYKQLKILQQQLDALQQELTHLKAQKK